MDFSTTIETSGLRLREGIESPVTDLVATEVPVALEFNGRDYAVMMATPADLEDFAVGFCLTEGIVERPQQILAIDAADLLTGMKLSITISETCAKALEGRERHLEGRTGCGKHLVAGGLFPDMGGVGVKGLSIQPAG